MAIPQVDEIFFRNALTSFADEKAKLEFRDQWLTPYFAFPNDFYVVLMDSQMESEGGVRVIAYLTGCQETKSEAKRLKHIRSLFFFESLFDQYPSHLHINTHPDFHGLGVGSLLLKRFVSDLTKANSKGVFLVTAEGARNVSFYTRMGFELVETKNLRGRSLVFLGKKLSNKSQSQAISL
jgi:GNAT superfamily N-acetyltransferase